MIISGKKNPKRKRNYYFSDTQSVDHLSGPVYMGKYQERFRNTILNSHSSKLILSPVEKQKKLILSIIRWWNIECMQVQVTFYMLPSTNTMNQHNFTSHYLRYLILNSQYTHSPIELLFCLFFLIQLFFTQHFED